MTLVIHLTLRVSAAGRMVEQNLLNSGAYLVQEIETALFQNHMVPRGSKGAGGGNEA